MTDYLNHTCPRDNCTGILSVSIRSSVPGLVLVQCNKCFGISRLHEGGGLSSLDSFLHKMVLGDDKVLAAMSPDEVGTLDSIPQELNRTTAFLEDIINTFGGRLNQRLGQLQSRLHFLHGQLAGAALAHPELGELVATAKQALDIVAARPTGPLAAAGEDWPRSSEPPKADAGG